MKELENKEFHENGIFDYETTVEMRKKAGELMTQIAEFSSKTANLNLDDDLDSRCGYALTTAINVLSDLGAELAQRVGGYRRKFSSNISAAAQSDISSEEAKP